MMPMQKALVWLRRDLRLYDNAALHHALKNNAQVWLAFIFDTDILNPLRTEDLDERGLKHDRRVDFIWQGLKQIDEELRKQGGGLIVQVGKPTECIPKIAKTLGVNTVYTNRDYEPSAIARDAMIKASLDKLEIEFESFFAFAARFDDGLQRRSDSIPCHRALCLKFVENGLAFVRRQASVIAAFNREIVEFFQHAALTGEP